MTIKPKNQSFFRELIIDTIKKDENAMPGRAGETSISDLAGMFEKLKNKEADEAIEAIANLINTPPDPLPTTDPKDFWFSIMFLSNYPNGEKSSLRDAFFARLFGSKALNRNLLIWMFNGYISADGILDQAQLKGLSFLQDESPAAWLNAAVRNRHFEFVKKETTRLLQEGKFSSKKTNTIIACLDFWKKSWPVEEDFFKIIEDFQNAAQDLEAKENLEKWIQRRKKATLS